MIVCPVCEHPQESGAECDVCGKNLAPLGALAADVVVVPMEGLEVSTVDVGEVPVERLGELEGTRFGDVAVMADVTPDLERTQAEPVGAVPVEPMVDMAEDRAPDDGVRTAAPLTTVVCRYCRNVQTVGAICERCGMRLPRVIIAPLPGVARVGEQVRCRACGAPALQGTRCSECGTEVPAA